MTTAFWPVLIFCLAAAAAPFFPRLWTVSGTLQRCAAAILLFSMTCGLLSELALENNHNYSALGATVIAAAAVAAASAAAVLFARAVGDWWKR